MIYIDRIFFIAFFILILFDKKPNLSLLLSVTLFSGMIFLGHTDKIAVYLFFLILSQTVIKNLRTKYSEEILSAQKELSKISEQKKSLEKLIQESQQDHKTMQKAYEQTLETSELIKSMNKTMDFKELFFLFADKIRSKTDPQSVQLILAKQDKNTISTKKHFVYPHDSTPQNLSDIFDRIDTANTITRLDDKIIAHTDELDGYITVLIIENPRNKSIDTIKPLITPFFMEIKKSFLFDRIKTMSIIDGLTLLYQRRYFMTCLEEELERAKTSKLNFSILMMDIDDFKKYNDLYGHLTGDLILREIGSIIKQTIRNNDLPARYGGEEFVFFLPQTTPKGAMIMAERLSKKIREHLFSVQGIEFNVTASIGVSNYPDHGESISDLIETADKNLYSAKNQGKNQVQ